MDRNSRADQERGQPSDKQGLVNVGACFAAAFRQRQMQEDREIAVETVLEEVNAIRSVLGTVEVDIPQQAFEHLRRAINGALERSYVNSEDEGYVFKIKQEQRQALVLTAYRYRRAYGRLLDALSEQLPESNVVCILNRISLSLEFQNAEYSIQQALQVNPDRVPREVYESYDTATSLLESDEHKKSAYAFHQHIDAQAEHFHGEDSHPLIYGDLGWTDAAQTKQSKSELVDTLYSSVNDSADLITQLPAFTMKQAGGTDGSEALNQQDKEDIRHFLYFLIHVNFLMQRVAPLSGHRPEAVQSAQFTAGVTYDQGLILSSVFSFLKQRFPRCFESLQGTDEDSQVKQLEADGEIFNGICNIIGEAMDYLKNLPGTNQSRIVKELIACLHCALQGTARLYSQNHTARVIKFKADEHSAPNHEERLRQLPKFLSVCSSVLQLEDGEIAVITTQTSRKTALVNSKQTTSDLKVIAASILEERWATDFQRTRGSVSSADGSDDPVYLHYIPVSYEKIFGANAPLAIHAKTLVDEGQSSEAHMLSFLATTGLEGQMTAEDPEEQVWFFRRYDYPSQNIISTLLLSQSQYEAYQEHCADIVPADEATLRFAKNLQIEDVPEPAYMVQRIKSMKDNDDDDDDGDDFDPVGPALGAMFNEGLISVTPEESSKKPRKVLTGEGVIPGFHAV